MSILERQNSPANLQLLAAQRHLYAQAKKLQHWRMIGTVGIAAIAPLALLLVPSSKPFMAVIGGLWLLVSRLVFEGLETKKVKQAANVQEQFDVTLFDIPWNRILVGDKLTPELVSAAHRAFSGDRDMLKNWYPDTGNLPYPLDVLLCQRSSLVMDWRLRRHYAVGISVLTVLLFSAGVVLAVVTNQSLLDYVLALLLPSLAALLRGVEVAKKHFEVAAEKEKTEKEVSNLWESGLRDPGSVSKEQCRHVQDCIYVFRSRGPLVPDQWYTWLRERYEIDMESAAAEMKSRAEQMLEL